MTVLCRDSILREQDHGDLHIAPFDPVLVQPASVDLRLGPHFKRYRPESRGKLLLGSADVEAEMELWTVEEGGSYILNPGEFVLAATLERIVIGPTLVARIEGKSGLGRRGLVVHVTAGFIDPGFEGWPTLEIANLSPVRHPLTPGMRICQLAFERLDAPPSRLYEGSYQNQSPEPKASQLRW